MKNKNSGNKKGVASSSTLSNSLMQSSRVNVSTNDPLLGGASTNSYNTNSWINSSSVQNNQL